MSTSRSQTVPDLRVSMIRRKDTSPQVRQLIDGLREQAIKAGKVGTLNIHHNSPFRTVWVVLRVLFALYLATAAPVRFGFLNRWDDVLILDYILDVFFLVDFFLYLFFFSTVAVTFNDVVYLSTPSDIFRHNIRERKMRLLLKLLATLSIDIPFAVAGNFRVANALRLLKLLHLAFLESSFQYILRDRTAVVINPIVRRMFRLFMQIIFSAHCFACCFYRLGVYEENGGSDSWFKTKDPGGINQAQPLPERYLKSLYWAIVTMTSVGYGDFTPVQETEIAFAIFVELFGWFSYGRLVANIAPLLASNGAPKQTFLTHMDEVQAYMQTENVPLGMQARVLRYYETMFARFNGAQEADLYHDIIPPDYRHAIGMHLYGKTMASMPMFQGVAPSVQMIFTEYAQFESYLKGDLIVRRGENSERFSMILKGLVAEITAAHDETDITSWLRDGKPLPEHTSVMLAGESFGQTEFMWTERNAIQTLVAAEAVDVAYITRDHFEQALETVRAFDEASYHKIMQNLEEVPPPTKSKDFRRSSTDVHRQRAKTVDALGYWVVLPGSRFKRNWDFVSLCCVIYYAMIIPFRITFWLRDWGGLKGTIDFLWFSLGWIIDIFFWVDIYMRLNHFALENTVDRQRPIIHREKFRWAYMTDWNGLWLDVVAGIPLEVFELLSSNRPDYVLLLSLNKLIRVRRILSYYRHVSGSAQRELQKKAWGGSVLASASFFSVFKIVAMTYVLFHWLGCFFFFMGERELEDGTLDAWVRTDATEDLDGNGNLVFLRGRLGRYIRSLHWTFVTGAMVGYGGITPATVNEIAYATIIVFFATLMYIYILSKITVFAETLIAPSHKFEQNMEIVNKFVDTHKEQLPPGFENRIRRYRNFLFSLQKSYDFSGVRILDQFPDHLRSELVHSVTHDVLKEHFPVFERSHFKSSFFMMLAGRMENRVYAAEDWIVRMGTPAMEVYILMTGTVYKSTQQQFMPLTKKSHRRGMSSLSTIPTGNDVECLEGRTMFGHVTLFDLDHMVFHGFSYQAARPSSVFVFTKAGFLNVLAHHPKLDKQYRRQLSRDENLKQTLEEEEKNVVNRAEVEVDEADIIRQNSFVSSVHVPNAEDRRRSITINEESAVRPVNQPRVSTMGASLAQFHEQAQDSGYWEPSDPRRALWDLLKVIAIVWFTVIVPLRIGFAKSNRTTPERVFTVTTLVIDGIFDVLMLVDIFYLRKYKLTQIVRGDRLLPHSAYAIYRQRSLKLDILSALVVDNLALFLNNGVRIVYWLRLFKLIRLRRFNSVHEHLEQLMSERAWKGRLALRPAHIRIMKQLLMVLCFAHFFACFWWFVGREQDREASWKNSDGIPVSCGFNATLRTCQNGFNLGDRYLQSLYYSIVSMSTVGYGDIKPVTTSETFITMMLLLVGLVLYAGVTGNIAALLSNADATRTEFDQEQRVVERFLDVNAVHQQLRDRVRKYYSSLWKTYFGVDPRLTLDSLPPSLRADVTMLLYGHYLRHLYIFFKIGDRTSVEFQYFTRRISAVLIQRQYGKEEFLTVAGETVSHMWILVSGTVQKLDGQDIIQEIHAPLRNRPDSYATFGELNVLSSRPRVQRYDLRSISVSATFLLRHDDLANLYKEFGRNKRFHLERTVVEADVESENEESKSGAPAPQQLGVDEKVDDEKAPQRLNTVTVAPPTRAKTHHKTESLSIVNVVVDGKKGMHVFEGFIRRLLRKALRPPRVDKISKRVTFSASQSIASSVNETSHETGNTMALFRAVSTSLQRLPFPTTGFNRLWVGNSRFPQWWNLLAMLALLFHMIVVPGLLVFVGAENLTKFWLLVGFAWAVDLFFIIDFVFRAYRFVPYSYLARTGKDADRPVISNSSLVWQEVYIQQHGWIFACTHIVALLPIDIIAVLIASASGSYMDNVSTWLGYYRANHALLAILFPTVMAAVDQGAEYNSFFLFTLFSQRAGKLAWIIILCLHWLACVWFLIGDLSTGNTWVTEELVLDRSPFGRYIVSLYWACTTVTTVGYGDITPINTGEIVYTLMAILLGDILYADIIGSLAAQEGAKYEPYAAYLYTAKTLKRYLRYREVPDHLERRLLDWHQYTFFAGEEEERAALDLLPEFFVADITNDMERFTGLEQCLPYLKESIDRIFLSKIKAVMTRRVYMADDVLFAEGDFAQELLFVLHGEGTVYASVGKDVRSLSQDWISSGQYSSSSLKVDADEKTELTHDGARQNSHERSVNLSSSPSSNLGSLLSLGGSSFTKSFTFGFSKEPLLAVLSDEAARVPELLDENGNLTGAPVKPGELLGGADFFMGLRHSQTIVCSAPTEVFVLSRHDLGLILALYPQHREPLLKSFLETQEDLKLTAEEEQKMMEHWNIAKPRVSDEIFKRAQKGSRFAQRFTSLALSMDTNFSEVDRRLATELLSPRPALIDGATQEAAEVVDISSDESGKDNDDDQPPPVPPVPEQNEQNIELIPVKKD